MRAFAAQVSSFSTTSSAHALVGRESGLGKFLFTIRAALQMRTKARVLRGELARLDLHLLDDVGLTAADRDALLRR